MDRPDSPDRDMDTLLGRLEATPVPLPDGVRGDLIEQLARHMALRRGEGDLPANWALCPFDRFCVAEQPIPDPARANCPCLRGAPLLRLLKSHGLPIHARPCAALRLRQAAAAAPSPAGR